MLCAQCHLKEAATYGICSTCAAESRILEKWKAVAAATPTAAVESEGMRYERLEKEHLGDPDKKTGIYAPKPSEAVAYAASVALAEATERTRRLLPDIPIATASPQIKLPLFLHGLLRHAAPDKPEILFHGQFVLSVDPGIGDERSVMALVERQGDRFLIHDTIAVAKNPNRNGNLFPSPFLAQAKAWLDSRVKAKDWTVWHKQLSQYGQSGFDFTLTRTSMEAERKFREAGYKGAMQATLTVKCPLALTVRDCVIADDKQQGVIVCGPWNSLPMGMAACWATPQQLCWKDVIFQIASPPTLDANGCMSFTIRTDSDGARCEMQQLHGCVLRAKQSNYDSAYDATPKRSQCLQRFGFAEDMQQDIKDLDRPRDWRFAPKLT